MGTQQGYSLNLLMTQMWDCIFASLVDGPYHIFLCAIVFFHVQIAQRVFHDASL